MKTILCGPPHSGKSVLLANLQRLMPSDSFQRITANGDGEGAWSNNPNQEEVKRIRVKSHNTPEEFALWTRLINNAQQDIVLVDIGGRLQEDKVPLFQASDQFVIVCSRDMLKEEPDIVERWKTFGEDNGCKCIAIVYTVLEGKEEIYETSPIFTCQMSNLERGRYLRNSKVLKGLADTIITKSEYIPTLNFNVIAHQLGGQRSWRTKNGVLVEHACLTYKLAPVLQQLLQEEYSDIGYARIVGADSNWVASIAAKCLCGDTPEHISIYDYWTNSFVNLAKLETSDHPDDFNKGLVVNVEETDAYVRLLFNVPELGLDTARYKDYRMPVINESKPLLVSGRFPNWFMASIVMSYQSPVKYLHVPGRGYVCVEHPQIEELGSIADSKNVHGFQINQYVGKF